MFNIICICGIIFALIKVAIELHKFFSNSVIIKNSDNIDLLEKMRIDLVKQTIKSDYFSILYFTNINNQEMLKVAKADLKNINVPEDIINDIDKLSEFVNNIFTDKIKIKFNQETKQFIYTKN